MAKELTSGERQVFTTPSSLASRMGVVKANAGDPVELATSELGKTLNFIAKQKAIQAEEKWKADVKVSSLEKISKFSQDYRYNPSDFINNATGFRDGLLESAPKAFRDWTRTYLAQLITTHSNQIIDATWKRDQKELLLKNTESNESEISRISSLIMDTPWQDHTKLWEEINTATLQDMDDSYRAIYETIPTEFRNANMPTPDEQRELWKKQLEGTRNASIATKIMHDAIEVDKQRIADGILVGDEINGWVGPSAVDDALVLIKEMMLGYEMNGITGRKEVIEEFQLKGGSLATESRLDGPWAYVDLDRVERTVVNHNTVKIAEDIATKYKTESAALTNQQTEILNNEIELFTGGGPGAVNDTFTLFNTELEVENYITQNFVGASTEKQDKIKDAWRVAHAVVRHHKETLIKIENGGQTFGNAVDNIVRESASMGITVKKEDIELALADRMIGYVLGNLRGDPYLDVSKVGFEENGNPTSELIALGQVSQRYGYIHPSLQSVLQSAGQINIKENPEAIISLANVVGYLQDRAGAVPANTDFAVWIPLLELNTRLTFMSGSPTGSVMTKDKLLERYLMQVNPSRTDLDEKIAIIDKVLKADTTWSGTSEDTLKSPEVVFEDEIYKALKKEIDKQWTSGLAWNNFGLSILRDVLGMQDYPFKGMVPDSPEDLNFYMDSVMPLFKDLVTQHLAWSYSEAGHIMPSNIQNHFQLAVQGAINEITKKGFKWEKIN